ncbi:protein yippee-like At4g27745 isoform X1 [Andrographis paniculata]|uniref:protein yippee-like At4g27745 isoform X1 n=2 Tax=Andrographis paniculata TaxID=175694 RepID=UPI0021E831F2|nr:protein yippee-like At4g27745 isoform X1 [Andrographis paniculata]XP_051138350.1 protein yippee-like At4g27745 isoform X1 [Andrographis paniculata]
MAEVWLYIILKLYSNLLGHFNSCFLIPVRFSVLRDIDRSMGEFVGPRLYCCYKCRNHVSLHDDIISKAFQGRHGRAFLFSHAMNIVVGAREDRNLMTGLHTVADISCRDCGEVLGWKYERAYDASQKYKEGKFIMEKPKIVKENW